MSSLHIILVPQAGTLLMGGHASKIEVPGLLLMASNIQPEAPAGGRAYSYPAARLQPIYQEMQHLLCRIYRCMQPDTPHTMPADEGMLHAVEQLANVDSDAMLRFVLAYSLATDCESCSALLRYLVAPDSNLFDMIHRHRLEPWPVARYADMLGLSQRKFNQLFNDKYGMSAKQWLLTQRLEHAKLLLETTTKKVIDVALESGFCNPAHFSDSFRRHFCTSPSDIKRESQPTTLMPSLLL